MLQLNDPNLLKTCSFIDGCWLKSEEKIAILNPATQQLITKVDNAEPEIATKAIVAANQAFNHWKGLSVNERATKLRAWFDLMIEHQNDLAQLLTIEQGKPLTEAMAEINYGASYLEWFAEEAKRIYGDTVASNNHSKKNIIIKQPVGVVTAITPWNFPNAMIMRKAAAALAAGCSFVVRPATQTPLSALAMAELSVRAGIPAGVFNVIIAEDAQATGKILTQHSLVKKFSFTGSTTVGKLLSSQCAQGIKKISMELGGNAPFIVFEDADIDAAIQGAMASKFRNAGQTCVASNRFYVHEAIFSTFTARLLAEVKKLNVGNGLDNKIHIGPLISKQAVQRTHAIVNEAIEQGATLLLGGEIHQTGEQFYTPTILSDVTAEMAILQQELFAPVITLVSFSDQQSVIEQANNTEYGLAAYFYTQKLNRVWQVAEALEYGMIGINEGIISNASIPFGGVKQSGNGREGSKYGLDDYLEIKYLCLNTQ